VSAYSLPSCANVLAGKISPNSGARLTTRPKKTAGQHRPTHREAGGQSERASPARFRPGTICAGASPVRVLAAMRAQAKWHLGAQGEETPRIPATAATPAAPIAPQEAPPRPLAEPMAAPVLLDLHVTSSPIAIWLLHSAVPRPQAIHQPLSGASLPSLSRQLIAALSEGTLLVPQTGVQEAPASTLLEPVSEHVPASQMH